MIRLHPSAVMVRPWGTRRGGSAAGGGAALTTFLGGAFLGLNLDLDSGFFLKKRESIDATISDAPESTRLWEVESTLFS